MSIIYATALYSERRYGATVKQIDRPSFKSQRNGATSIQHGSGCFDKYLLSQNWFNFWMWSYDCLQSHVFLLMDVHAYIAFPASWHRRRDGNATCPLQAPAAIATQAQAVSRLTTLKIVASTSTSPLHVRSHWDRQCNLMLGFSLWSSRSVYLFIRPPSHRRKWHEGVATTPEWRGCFQGMWVWLTGESPHSRVTQPYPPCENHVNVARDRTGWFLVCT